MHDRYGNSVTTTSSAAFDAYCAGVDLFLAAQAGGIEALVRATQLDPAFALAHADLARALQIAAQPKPAREHIAKAREHCGELTGQELAHVQIMGHLLDGNSAGAFEQIKTHIADYPRDVLTVQPCCGVFGLIGFSGRLGREQENADFMAALQPSYQGDWWFESQYAFALCEIGQLDAAEALNEKAFAANPDNANAVHHRAHIHYETGEFDAGRSALAAWRKHYDRASILHCHLGWHEALWAIAAGEFAQVWQILAADIMPDVASAPPINIMTDMVALLLRAEMAGAETPPELWGIASEYAQSSFPRPGVSFADAHSAIAYTRSGASDALAALQTAEKGWAADQVESLANGFAAFDERDWQQCADQFAPVMTSHERLGGSRAQRDLLELVYGHAQLQLGVQPASARLQALAGSLSVMSKESAGAGLPG